MNGSSRGGFKTCRGRLQPALAALVFLLSVWPASADVILTAAGLNDALKNMERFQQQIAAAPAGTKAEPQFLLGMQAEALAELLNDEVAAHGMDEKALIDLALQRTKEMGIAIAYDRDKRKFFYDLAAFRQALEDAPQGARAADARFKLLEGEFFKATGTDARAIEAGVGRKQAFLREYPRFAANVEVHMMLAVDYRDLTRLALEAKDKAAYAKYRALTRTELQLIPRRFPKAEQAEIARRMLERFDEQFK